MSSNIINKIRIRKYNKTDFNSVLELEQEAFGKLLANRFEILFSSLISDIYIVELASDNNCDSACNKSGCNNKNNNKNNIIGAVFLVRLQDAVYVCNGAIKEEYRNKKIAQTILPTILSDLKNSGVRLVFALIEADNKASQNAVKKSGFKEGRHYNIPITGEVIVFYNWIND